MKTFYYAFYAFRFHSFSVINIKKTKTKKFEKEKRVAASYPTKLISFSNNLKIISENKQSNTIDNDNLAHVLTWKGKTQKSNASG